MNDDARDSPELLGWRVAEDQEFLTLHDDHIHPEVVESLIRAQQILIVEDAQDRLGWLRWNLFWDEIPFLNMLFVLESHRGRGLGSALMNSWEQRVARGGDRATMTSTQADEDAQHFYRKRGYVDCGALLLPDQVAEIIFRKELPTSAIDARP